MISDSFDKRQSYWNVTAETYDQIFPDTLIGQTQRSVVWRQIERVFQPGQRILEINCGTGIDAVHLAERGIHVLACDLSPRMIELAIRRSIQSNTTNLTQFRVLPTERISQLIGEGHFDGALSNFSGLNCVENLSLVAHNLGELLRPSASAIICMAGRIAPLQVAWYLAHGHVKQAMRRLCCSTDDSRIRVHFPTVRAIARSFAPKFRLRQWQGIGVAVPPSCMEPLAQRFPLLLKMLQRADDYLAPCPILRGFADCVLLHFERLSI